MYATFLAEKGYEFNHPITVFAHKKLHQNLVRRYFKLNQNNIVMNYLKSVFYISICILAVSCGTRYTNNAIILRAESLLNSKPDSAYHILSTISHPEKLSKADYAAWCLLYTHAQYKLYKDIKSDSIIRIAVDYYDRTKLYKQNGTVYYLLGCIKKANKQKREALIAFKKADYLLEKTDETDLKGIIKFNIGNVYWEDEVFNQSLSNFKKALECFIITKNIKYQAYAYRGVSDMYNQFDYPFDTIMRYSNIALKLSKEAGDTINYYSILAQQGELLYDKDYSRAKECLLKGYQNFPALRANYATLLAYVYCKLHQRDSAKFYLKIPLKDTLEMSTNAIRFYVRAHIAKDEGNLIKAYDFYKKAYTLRNTFFKNSLKNQLYRLDKQYDLSQKEKENAALKISNRNKVIVITVFIIIILIGLIIFTLLFHKSKRNKMAQSMEMQKLEYEIKMRKAENTKKRALLLSKIQNKVDNTLRLNLLNMGTTASEKMEVFLKEISKQSIITDQEWHDYIDEVNHIFDNKIKQLQETNPQLTNTDIKVISLIFLKLDISECCSLLNMNKNTMYHRRKIIKERMGISKDVDLESYLINYMETESSNKQNEV